MSSALQIHSQSSQLPKQQTSNGHTAAKYPTTTHGMNPSIHTTTKAGTDIH
eukprot:jgi/Botrbrau1/17924/Bobra.50_1s0025.1